MTFDTYKLELLQAGQATLFFHLIDRNRARLEDFFAGTVSKTKTLEDAILYGNSIQMKIKEKSYFPFIISDNRTDEFIGLVDVKNIDWNVPKAELGLFIDEKYEGKGIATKATKILVDHLIGKYSFKKLLCRASSRNLGSVTVIEKCGFELEGTIRNDYRTTKGEIVDLNYYGRVF